MKKKNIILSAVSVVLTAFAVTSTILLNFYKVTIDKFFLGQGASFEGYDASSARVVCEDIEREAVVLLKNENNMLPFKASSSEKKKVALFGMGAYDMRFAGAGSGGGNAEGADSFTDALKKKNIDICPDLEEFYSRFNKTDSSTGGFDDVGKEIGSPEVAWKNFNDEIKTTAKRYSDTAIYVVTRVGGEGSTLTDELLSLTKNEEQTLDFIAQSFENVLVVLNTSNPLELGFLDGKGTSRSTSENYSKYAGKIDACVWIGLPGYTGANAVAEVLTGTSPSGKLADTYAYDVNSNPSVFAVDNAEGIYTGYRYYETAAFEGSIDYDSYERNAQPAYANKKIAEGVQYPFGYGLSYTTFEKKIVKEKCGLIESVSNSEKNSEIKVAVEITNTGNVAGREVVQLYYTPPYVNGGIEKAYVNLADFAKTKSLAPGESEMVELTFNVSDMKSFDETDKNSNGFKGYELEKGTYILRVLDGAHGWKKIDENSSLAIKVDVTENIKYDTDEKTGSSIGLKFADYSGKRQYVSRNNHFENLSVTTEVGEQIQYSAKQTEEKNDYKKGVDYAVEYDKTITFDEMKGVAYNDEKWDKFVSQLTKSEMAEIIAMGNFQTAKVERLGIPKTLLFDGPAAIKDTYRSDKGCLLYPSECSAGATWNKEIMYEFGSSAGDDAVQCGVTGWYAPGVNLHLNAFTARGFEYFSECPVLSGKLAVAESKGAESKGLIVIVKHLVDGVSGAINEQALREIYLKPFEIAVKDAGIHGLMTSYTLLGTWVGQVAELINGIIRGEWGFIGFVTSDAASPSMQVSPGIRAGNDIWLATDNGRYTTLVREEKNVAAMKQACKNVLYTVSLSPMSGSGLVVENSFSPSVLMMILIDALSAVGVALCLSFVIVPIVKEKKKAK